MGITNYQERIPAIDCHCALINWHTKCLCLTHKLKYYKNKISIVNSSKVNVNSMSLGDLQNLDSIFNDFDQHLIEIPNNPAVQNGIITLIGGHDRQKTSIVLFPLEMHLKIHLNQVSKEQMINGIEYYYEIMKTIENNPGISFLIDFRAGSLTIINAVIETIISFQYQNPDINIKLFVILPPDARLVSQIKKILKISEPKTLKQVFKISNTKVIEKELKSFLVKNSLDLNKYVDSQNLTNEFGGLLKYDHKTWLLLQQDIFNYLSLVLSNKNKVFQAEKDILKLKNYKTSKKNISLAQIMNETQKRFDNIIKTSAIDEIIKESDLLLAQLKLYSFTNEDLKYKSLRGNAFLNTNYLLVTMIKNKYSEISKYFQNILNDIKKQLKSVEDIKVYSTSLNEEILWIKEIGIPNLQHAPKIASNVDDAESIARAFHNHLYIPGIKYLSKFQDISMETLPKEDNIEDFNTIFKFKEDLEIRRKLYSEIYQFHLFLAQILKWLTKTIKYLPIEQLDYLENADGNEILELNESWKRKIGQYLEINPPPKPAHIYLIECITERMTNVNFKKETLVLLNKLKLLLRLFNCTDVTVEDIRQVIEWKFQMQFDESETESERSIEDLKYFKGNQKEISNTLKFDRITIKSKAKGFSDFIPQEKAINCEYANPVNATFDGPNYHYDLEAATRLNEYKTPRNNIQINRELIEIAEKTISESLQEAHLTREIDLRIPKYLKEEDELSIILNQLLYDIDSSAESLSENPSSSIFEKGDGLSQFQR